MRVVETRGRVRKGLEKVYMAYSHDGQYENRNIEIGAFLAPHARVIARGALLP